MAQLGKVRATMKHYDVVIIGGGIVGSATAYYLLKHGFKGSIAIAEKDTTYQFSCTARSAGGLRQQFSTPENIALSMFGLKLVRNLKTEFGPDADAGFKEQGYLILASEEGVAILEENHRVQIANGADNTVLSHDDLQARFPWLVCDGLAAGCFGLSGEGWMDPYLLMSLFRKAAVAQGVAMVVGDVVSVAASGGARMQEGLASLMQMAKTTAALTQLAQKGLPYISVLTDPTMGGVSASFCFLGDVVIAEPKALIGFAGPRVIEQTVREKLPEGFQRSEFLIQKGAIDMIVDRRHMRDEIAGLIALLEKKPLDAIA